MIPNCLKKLNNWVVSKGDSKIPLNAKTLKKAGVNRPNSWHSYDVAIQRVENKEADYVGFVFNDNGIIGIDIDTGFDGFMPTDTAIDIIEACKSYTEISKSGRGFHIFIKGNIDFKGRNIIDKGLEIYKTGRYFITTGNNVLYQNVIENQEGIDYVVNKYFKEEVKENKRGSNFKVYNFTYPEREGDVISLDPIYPEIKKGGRNIALTSLAGQLKIAGWDKQATSLELHRANEVACKPPLRKDEVNTIIRSVYKYEN